MDTIETLQAFCANSTDDRKKLHTPFIRNGYAYGTNGHFVVRHKADGLALDELPATDLPKLESIFANQFNGEFRPLPKIKEPSKCKDCRGKGWAFQKECEDCSGQGEFDHCGLMYHCKACDGDGSIRAIASDGGKKTDCSACYGRGHKQGSLHAQRIGGALFALTYLWQLSKYEGIQFSAKGAAEGAAFRFGAFEGVLMPVRT